MSKLDAYYNDPRYADTLRKAATYYFKEEHADTCEFYDTVRDAVTLGTDLRPLLDTIADKLPDTPMAIAIRIENTCRKISEEI